MILEKLEDCVISGNTFHRSCLEKMFFDLGGHSGEMQLKDNVGRAYME